MNENIEFLSYKDFMKKLKHDYKKAFRSNDRIYNSINCFLDNKGALFFGINLFSTFSIGVFKPLFKDYFDIHTEVILSFMVLILIFYLIFLFFVFSNVFALNIFIFDNFYDFLREKGIFNFFLNRKKYYVLLAFHDDSKISVDHKKVISEKIVKNISNVKIEYYSCFTHEYSNFRRLYEIITMKLFVKKNLNKNNFYNKVIKNEKVVEFYLLKIENEEDKNIIFIVDGLIKNCDCFQNDSCLQ